MMIVLSCLVRKPLAGPSGDGLQGASGHRPDPAWHEGLGPHVSDDSKSGPGGDRAMASRGCRVPWALEIAVDITL